MSDATGLTPIERDALQVFAEGWPWRASGRRFADLTGRADRTYRRVLLRAERKLGARSRIHAVALAAAQGLIKVDGAPTMPDPTAPERTPPMLGARTDAHLWARMLEPLKAAGIEAADALARDLVAVVRREESPDAEHLGPSDTIPDDVVAVTDLDGDVWLRGSGDHPDHWTMRDYDRREHDRAAAGVQLTPFLATAYGPLTRCTHIHRFSED